MNDSLTFLLEKSKNNKELTERIYATQNGRNPVNALCELATAEGFPITAAELLYDGEETCAAMCRSVKAVELIHRTAGTMFTRCFSLPLTI